MDNFNSSFIVFLQENIPFFVNNAEVILSITLSFLISFFLILWFYCGFFALVDSSNRIENSYISLLLGILGILLGPFFLVMYLLFRPKTTFEEKIYMALEKRFFYSQAARVINCINCGKYVLEGQKFCVYCGTQNRFECSDCSNLVEYDDDYCSLCGKSLLNESFHNNEDKEVENRSEGILIEYWNVLKLGFVRIKDQLRLILSSSRGFNKIGSDKKASLSLLNVDANVESSLKLDSTTHKEASGLAGADLALSSNSTNSNNSLENNNLTQDFSNNNTDVSVNGIGSNEKAFENEVDPSNSKSIGTQSRALNKEERIDSKEQVNEGVVLKNGNNRAGIEKSSNLVQSLDSSSNENAVSNKIVVIKQDTKMGDKRKFFNKNYRRKKIKKNKRKRKN